MTGRTDADRLIASLDGEFSAAIGAEEDAAADDLAFSLSQDISIMEDLARDGGSLLMAGAEVWITRVAHDFVTAGDWLVPTDRAVVRVGGGRRACRIPDVFLAALRRLARAEAEVVAGAGRAGYRGRLARATPEHVLIDGIERVALPLAAVDYVRLVRAGSADVL